MKGEIKMKKNLIKKMATLGLIGALFIPNLVFAADTVTSASTKVPPERPTAERPLKEDLKDRAEGIENRMQKGQERRDQFDDRTLELVTLYAPELLDSYQAAMDSHDAIHDSLETLRKTEFENDSAAFKEFLTTIKDQLTSGTITREEAKTQIDGFREENKADREASKSEIEALQATYGIDPEAHRTLMDSLKTAIDNKDETAIKAALTSLLPEFQNHVSFDQAVYNLLISK